MGISAALPGAPGYPSSKNPHFLMIVCDLPCFPWWLWMDALGGLARETAGGVEWDFRVAGEDFAIIVSQILR